MKKDKKATTLNHRCKYMDCFKRENAITLVALIVTIIILVILAAVTIDQVFDLKIIETAINGTQNYTEAQIQEKEDLDDISKTIADAVKKAEIVEIKYNIGKEIKELEKANNRNITDEELKEILEKYGTLSEEGEKIEDKILTTNKGSYNLKVSDILKGPAEDMPDKPVNPTEPDKPVEPDKPKVAYLVDTAEIGDYVDIGIDYENKESFIANNSITTKQALTGWRVIGKSGSGETGTVKLVSAGCPMTYNRNESYTAYEFGTNRTILNLEDMYQTITVVSSGSGFRGNGFEDNNLQNVFTEEKHIDISKGVHALGCSTHNGTNTGIKATKYAPLNEIEALYMEITGQNRTMTQLKSMNYPLATTTLAEGENWKESYADLFAIGMSYRLGGASSSKKDIWYVNGQGKVSTSPNGLSGVRPVVSMMAGTKVEIETTANGSSSSLAYKVVD